MVNIFKFHTKNIDVVEMHIPAKMMMYIQVNVERKFTFRKCKEKWPQISTDIRTFTFNFSLNNF